MPKKSIQKESEHRPKEVATEAVEPNRTESGQGKSEEVFLAKKSLTFIAGILILFGLYLSSFYSYLLFHSLAEIFSLTNSRPYVSEVGPNRRYPGNLSRVSTLKGGVELIYSNCFFPSP